MDYSSMDNYQKAFLFIALVAVVASAAAFYFKRQYFTKTVLAGLLAFSVLYLVRMFRGD